MAQPPELPGNPGVPGLLAEIAELQAIIQDYEQFAPVPQTGQINCYDLGNVIIECTDTGQDGELQMGVEWPVPRFTDNDDGTVTDNLTGLIWLIDANCIGTTYPEFDNDTYGGEIGDGGVSWQHALDFVSGINDGTYANCGAGYNDWRLPNVRELYSLIDISNIDIALPSGHLFTNVQLGFYPANYWSSSTYAGHSTWAWRVLLSKGHIDHGTKYDAHYVLPVRDAQ
jgi:hypothetical protein